MSYIIEGIILGIGLAVSLGPIFVALTETSLDKGRLPGLTVGTGIWTSDIIIILVFFNFINRIKDTVESESFIFWMGISGALVLFFFGIYMIIKKPALEKTDIKLSAKNYFGFWLKGFAVNTLNPFTFIFWLGVISTYIIGRNTDTGNSIILLSTILIIIVLSDSLKVYLADKIRKKLTPKSVNYIFNFSGILLILFSLYMTSRVI